MKKFGTCFLLIATLTFGLLFSGCSNVVSKANITDDQSVTITDMGGDTVTLPTSIERVVSTSDPCTDMLVAFGQSDKLVGAYFRALENPWFKRVLPDLR